MNISFDKNGYIINGQRSFFLSGEFPYFRVPKKDWKTRLEQFKKSGGNCVATYVPWVIHEANEGEILFDDCDERSLTDFIKTVQEVGLALIVRPGPYVYSELINSGLPTWIARDYPEVLARDISGNSFFIESVSYLHPVFLQKVKRWYTAFSNVVRPYLSTNGGPITMIQVDNELIGVHVWWGSIDYHPETMGFGKEGGRYPVFLQDKYTNIENLNKAYGTKYSSFTEVYPKPESQNGVESARIVKDYHDFYCATVEEYAVVLKDYLRENGIDVSLCHNVSGSTMIPNMKDMNKKMGQDFILGVDNYYALNINWPQNNPTPQYFLRVLFGMDLLDALGNPPTVYEMPGGSPSQIPPILKEDLYTCYMTNLAAGMKGVNYYIYTGGNNVWDTGINTDVYDFCAFISHTGEIRNTHKALDEFHEFVHKNEWLASAKRFASVQVGAEWQTLRGNHYSAMAGADNTVAAQDKADKCVMLSLLSGKYSGKYIELTQEIDVKKPLIICGPDTMSAVAQTNVKNFVENGGKLLIFSTIATLNENFEPCTILSDFIGEMQTAKNDTTAQVTLINGYRVYGVSCKNKIITLPEGAKPFITDEFGKNILGFTKNIGKGEVLYCGGTWLTSSFIQVQALESILAQMDAKPCVESSNRTIYTTLFENDNKKGVFVLNLYTGAQESNIKVYVGDKVTDLGNIKLAPMEVKFILLNE